MSADILENKTASQQDSSKTAKDEDVVKATQEGRLYIETVDFFKQAKIQELVIKLKNSSIYKAIEAKKTETA